MNTQAFLKDDNIIGGGTWKKVLAVPDGDEYRLGVDAAVTIGDITISNADGAIQDGVSNTIRATVKDYTNSNPLAVIQVDTNGDPISGGAVSMADGANVTQGAITDSAVTGDNSGTVNAHLRGMDKILADTWDSVNHRLKVNVENSSLAVTQSGTWNIGAISSVVAVNDNGGSLTVDGTVTATIAAGASTIAKAEDVASADGDVGVPFLAVRKATPANTSGTDGDYEFAQISAGRIWTSATIDAALPAGSNAIGKLAANDGVDIGDVTINNASGASAVNVQDGGNSLTVDGTVAATQSGTWTVQPGNTANTTAWKVDASSVAVPVTDNSGSLTVDNAGTFAVQATLQAAASTIVGQVKLTDGTTVADVLDLTNHNPLTVAIVDGSGDQITSFGGGTQYTEDAAAAANPVGTAQILVRQDTPADEVSTNGDNIAHRGTKYGAAYVQLVSSTGSFLDSLGGGTQYTEDAASAADPVGNQLMLRRRDSLSSSEVSTDGDNIAANSTSKGELYVKHTDAIPVTKSGTWDITNAGTFAVQDSQVIADNAGFTDGTTKLFMGGFIYDEVAGTALTENDGAAARVNVNRAQVGIIEDGVTRARYATVTASNALKVDGSAVTQPVSIAATVTVDSELPAAAALADDTANPTTTSVGSLAMIYDPNDSNWDRARAITLALNAAAADSGIQAVGLTAQFDDVSPTTITENQWGNLRMSTNRNLYGTIRDAAGNERGVNVTSGNALQSDLTSLAGTATAVNNGTASAGVQRVTIASDSTGNIATIGTSVTPGTAATNLGKAEDAAHTTGDVGVMALGVRRAAATDLSSGGTDGDYEPFQVDALGKVWTTGSYAEDAAHTGGDTLIAVATRRIDTPATSSSTSGDYSTLDSSAEGAVWATLTPTTTGGLSTFMASGSDGSTALTSTGQAVKASAGNLYGYYIYNPNASAQFVHFYNAGTGSVTVGTTNPLVSFTIPATSAANLALPYPVAFGTAITIAATSTAGGNGAPSSSLDAVIWYK